MAKSVSVLTSLGKMHQREASLNQNNNHPCFFNHPPFGSPFWSVFFRGVSQRTNRPCFCLLLFFLGAPRGDHGVLLVRLHRVEPRGQGEGVQHDGHEDVQQNEVDQRLRATTQRPRNMNHFRETQHTGRKPEKGIGVHLPTKKEPKKALGVLGVLLGEIDGYP